MTPNVTAIREEPMDAIELLTQQHTEVKALFEEFKQSNESSVRVRIAAEATRALRAHTAIEEEIFYSAVRQARSNLSSDVLEGLEEHHVVEGLLDELEGMSSSNGERYEAKFTVVSELVEHHEELMAEAETDGMTREELYERAKKLDVEGRSQTSKRQLANAVRAAS